MSSKVLKSLLMLASVALIAGTPLPAAAPDCTGISAVHNTDPILDGELTTVRIAAGLARPVFVTAAPGDNERLFVLEQTGAIRLIKNDVLQVEPFMDLDPIVSGGGSGERGLLGLAFHPDYQNNGYFFVYYTSISTGPISNGDIVVARYEMESGNPDKGDDSTGEIVIHVPHPGQSNHNGGMMAFGADGKLYIGTGDGGFFCDPGPFPGNALNLNNNLGKLLRLDVDSLPYDTTGNPFDGATPGNDEIWGYGLRNPWRFSFDMVTDALYIGDVGQDAWEEVNCTPNTSTGGENYGWLAYEATHCPNPSCSEDPTCAQPNYLDPIREYSLAGSPCAVIGGYVYRGCRMPDLQGHYFYSDACNDFVNTFLTNGACNSTPTPDLNREFDLEPGGGISISSIVSYGQDNQGEMYLVELNGEVFKILPELNILELSGINATPLTVDANGDFHWENLPASSSHQVRWYNVYRSDNDPDGPFTCVHQQLVTTTTWVGGDPDTPSSGETFYYIVMAENLTGQFTHPGVTSDGTVRDVDTGSPCP